MVLTEKRKMRNLLKTMLVLLVVFCLLFSNSFTLIACAIDGENDNQSNIENKAEQIYKGVLYENFLSDTANELQYHSNIEINIEKLEDLDKITIIDENDKIISKNESVSNLNENEYYKEIRVSKDNFKNIFGEDGYINIFDVNGNQIHTININSDVDKDGKLLVGFDRFVSSIKLETSKPISTGKLKLEETKAIKSDNEYVPEQIDSFQKIQSNSKIEYLYKTLIKTEENKEDENNKSNEDGVQEDKKDTQENNTQDDKNLNNNEDKNTEQNSNEAEEENKNSNENIVENSNEQNTETNNTVTDNETKNNKFDIRNSNVNLQQLNGTINNEFSKDSNYDTNKEELPNAEENANTEEKNENIEETGTAQVIENDDIGKQEKEQEELKEEYEEHIEEANCQTIVELLDTENKVDMELSNTTWSTLSENNVMITAILRTDSYRYKLFSNPTIEIELPKEIKNISIENITTLYKGELSLDSWHLESLEDGTRKIVVTLNGIQTKYDIDAVNGGLNLMIDLKFDLYENTPTQNRNLKLICVNNGESYQKEMQVTLQSKYGLLSLSSLTVGDGRVNAIDSEIKTIEMPIMQPVQGSEWITELVNNYSSSLENTIIIGKLPTEKQTDGTDKFLDTFNIRLTGPIEIQGKGASVYYSTEESEVKESESWTENVENYEDIKLFKIVFNEAILPAEVVKIKYNMQVPEDLEYNNSAYISTTVTYLRDGVEESKTTRLGASTGIGPKVELKLNTETTTEKLYSGQVVTYNVEVKNTGSEDLENLTVKANIPEATSYTEYKEKENEARNTHAEFIDNPAIKDKTWNIENLKSGESKVFTLEIRVKKFEEESKKIDFQVEAIKSDGQTFAKNKLARTAYKSELDVELNTAKLLGTLSTDDTINYTIRIENISERKLKDITVESLIPQNTKYEFGYVLDETNLNKVALFNEHIEKEANVDGQTVKYEIGSLNPGEQKLLVLSVKIAKLQEETVEIENRIKVYEKNSENIYDSNVIKANVKTAILEIHQTTTTPKNILEGEDIDYIINIENKSNISSSILIEDIIPEEVLINSKTIQVNDEIIDLVTNNEISYATTINGHSTIMIKISGTAKELEEEIKEKEIINKVKVYLSSNNYEESEEIVKIIEKKVIEPQPGDDGPTEPDPVEPDPINPEPDVPKPIDPVPTDPDNPEPDNPTPDNPEPENPTPDEPKQDDKKPDNNNQGNSNNKPNNSSNNSNQEQNNNSSNAVQNGNLSGDKNQSQKTTHKIAGKVWFDIDGNGKFTKDENGIGKTKVKLYNQSATKSIKETTTNNDGKYEFAELEEGNYIVVFEYDTKNYTVTEYQKSGVSEDTNSDAKNRTITINGKETLVAMTDTITIKDKNKSDIDLGLISKDKFDLRLDKYISKVTVKDNKGTKEYKYGTEAFNKLDLERKTLKSTIVTIEYRFVITNEGTVDAYVNKIEDYMDSSLQFNEANNTGWLLKDGSLYNSSLTNNIIKPGEKKELNLVLTKTMTEDNLGVVTNKAEITEADNIKGLEEYDSKPGNKVETEDDYSKVELYLGIRTGGVIVYITLTIIVLAILASGTYLIKKYVLNKKEV